MTYKELIDTLTTIIDNHRLINQWGYGNLSDIETPENGAPNYPYMFINPVQVLIQSYGFDVTLNLITMDQPLEGVAAEIDSASRTLGLIQDVIAQFKQSTLYSQTDVVLSVTATPFKERFKDAVIGNTATVTFQIEEPLDICNDPVITTPDVPAPEYGALRVHATASQDYYIDPETGIISPTISQVFWFNNIIETDGNWNNYVYSVPEAGTYNVIIDLQITLTQPDESPEAISPLPRLLQVANGVATYHDATVATGWPTVFESVDTVYNVHLEYTVDAPLVTTTLEYVRAYPNTGYYDLEYYEKAGSSIKIYKA